jgi:hypothetical protein
MEMTTDTALKEFDLRSLPFSPDQNPFVRGSQIRTETKLIRTKGAEKKSLMDADTGEVIGASLIHTFEEKDEEHFVKIFAEGVKAAFELSRTAARVFQVVLGAYQREKMTGGFSDSISLFWFGDGIDGHSIGMSEFTFRRGLKELLSKGFLFPRKPNEYWVNPALFFKGNRVAFLKEYRLKPRQSAVKDNQMSMLEE